MNDEQKKKELEELKDEIWKVEQEIKAREQDKKNAIKQEPAPMVNESIQEAQRPASRFDIGKFMKIMLIGFFMVGAGYVVFSQADALLGDDLPILREILLRTALYGMIPLSGIGFYWISGKIVMLIRFSKGYYKVRFRNKNYTIKEVMVRPQGKNVIHKGRTYGFNKEPGNIYFGEMLIPTIEYDEETSQQLNFRAKTIDKEKLDPENLNAMFFRVYNKGKKDAMKMQGLMLWLIGAAALFSMVSALILVSILQNGVKLAAVT